MSRIPLPDTKTVVAESPHLFDNLDIADLNVASAAGNNPAALAGILEYMSVLYADLSVVDRELVILATARALESEYEWHQHVTVAREAGIPLATVRAIGTESLDDDTLDSRERALLTFVFNQCRGSQTDEAVDALTDAYTASEIATISLLAAHYTGIAQFIQSMAVPLEEPFIGWEPTGDLE